MTDTANSSVTLKVTDSSTYVVGKLNKDIYQEFKKTLGYKDPNAIWRSNNYKNWDGYITTVCYNKQHCKCSIKKDGVHFPTGLYSRAVDFFKAYCVPISVIDDRSPFAINKINIGTSKDLEFRDYQENVIDKAIKAQRGIIKSATGSGKCLRDSDICLTSDGMLTFKELGVGLSEKQYIEKFVTVASPLTENKREKTSQIYRDGWGPTRKYTTDKGFESASTPNHKIKILTKNGIEWEKVSELKVGDYVAICKNTQLFGNRIIYDTHFTGLMDKDDTCTEKSKKNNIVSINKSIPRYIRESNKTHVASFIRGLFETYGFCYGNKSSGVISIDFSSKELVDQLHVILLNFGIVAHRRLKKTSHSDSHSLTIYRDYIPVFADQIGFDPNGRKYKKLKNIVDSCKNQKSNSNCDLIPHQQYSIHRLKWLFVRIIGYKKIRNHMKHFCLGVAYSSVRSWSQSKSLRVPSRKSLINYVQYLKKNISEIKCQYNKEHNIFKFSEEALKICEYLENIYREDLFYDKIKSVEDDWTDNYDFVVPKTQSFIAQGFINHNTAIGAGLISKLGISPFIFYVTSQDLLRQAKSELERFLTFNNSPLDVGVIGGGKCEIRDVNIMTVQTAVRALGEKYQKFDEEDESEEMSLEMKEKYDSIANLIHNSKGIIMDECQHASAQTCQIISDHSYNARFKYGLSATPFRDLGDDLLIDACFGKVIAEISASFLIKQNILVKPTIYFVHTRKKFEDEDISYATAYKEGIVENDERNLLIANIAQNMVKQGRHILILVKHIEHGKFLETIIPDSLFLYGEHSSKIRQNHIDKMRLKKVSVTISSSLPYEEMIVIRRNGLIKFTEIGNLCERDWIDGDEALCSKNGKSLDWSKITAVHSHKLENKLTEVTTNHNEQIIVTENHSLVDSSLNQVLPLEGAKSACPMSNNLVLNLHDIKEIDVIDLLKKSDLKFEAYVSHTSYKEVQKIKSMAKYMLDKKSVGKSIRLRCKKLLLEKGNRYGIACVQMQKFKYEKGHIRCSISNLYKYTELHQEFGLTVKLRRSRSIQILPAFVPVDENLARICGLLCGDVHINVAKCITRKNRYDVVFTELLDINKSLEVKWDKRKVNIRNIFSNGIYSIFKKIKIVETDKNLSISGGLSWAFFKCLGVVSADSCKRMPDFIPASSNNVQDAFLDGLYLSDGYNKFNKDISFKKSNEYNGIVITNSSRRMISEISLLLRLRGIKYTISVPCSSHNCWDISILDNFADHKITRSKLDFNFHEFSDRTQKRVTYLDERKDQTVYDISVDACHNFIAGIGGILAHNSIFDEGVDIKSLDGLILSGSGKSQTRALQRVGRVIRTFQDPVTGFVKKDAYIVDFHDNMKYMLSHSRARRRIYETEPEFVIKDFKGNY